MKTKGPVPLERLPAFLHPHIKEAFAVYLQILQSRQRLQPSFSTRKMLAMPSRNGEHLMRELDPVHAYVQVTVAQDIQSQDAKVRILAALRSSHPTFSAYFDLIDGTTTGIASTEDWQPGFGAVETTAPGELPVRPSAHRGQTCAATFSDY